MSNLNVIWSLSRYKKRLISLVIDFFFITLSFLGAYWVRIGKVEALPSVESQYVLVSIVIITLLIFTKLGLYRAVLRYLSLHVLALVGLGTALSAVAMAGLAFLFRSEERRVGKECRL